jgi:hypothetical protein
MILCWSLLLVGVPVGVTIESLQCFAFLCFHSEDRLSIQLLAEFSSVLIPLTSGNQVWMYSLLYLVLPSMLFVASSNHRILGKGLLNIFFFFLFLFLFFIFIIIIVIIIIMIS